MFQTELKRKLWQKYWGKNAQALLQGAFRQNNEFMTSKMELACWNPLLFKLRYFSHSFLWRRFAWNYDFLTTWTNRLSLRFFFFFFFFFVNKVQIIGLFITTILVNIKMFSVFTNNISLVTSASIYIHEIDFLASATLVLHPFLTLARHEPQNNFLPKL